MDAMNEEEDGVRTRKTWQFSKVLIPPWNKILPSLEKFFCEQRAC